MNTECYEAELPKVVFRVFKSMAGETSSETCLFSRFSCRSDVDIDKLIEEKDSKSTKSSTKNAVKILREFCVEKGVQTEFENLSKTYK